jgi:protein-disulfide isomerase
MARTDLSRPVDQKDHLLGEPSAPLVLVEYGDYECPSCLNAVPVVEALRDQFGDRLAVVFRHFPQNSVHKFAGAAAQAAEAAGAQGKFWEMHKLLFKNQQRLGDIDLTHLALGLGLDVYRFQNDAESGPTLRRIHDDIDSATASGVYRTPTFFINGRRHDGSNDLPHLVEALEASRGTGV